MRDEARKPIVSALFNLSNYTTPLVDSSFTLCACPRITPESTANIDFWGYSKFKQVSEFENTNL